MLYHHNFIIGTRWLESLLSTVFFYFCKGKRNHSNYCKIYRRSYFFLCPRWWTTGKACNLKSLKRVNHLTLTLADPGGAAGARPLMVQILSFWHTNFTKRSHLGSWRPPIRLAPPYGKSWIRHWLVPVIFSESHFSLSISSSTSNISSWDGTPRQCFNNTISESHQSRFSGHCKCFTLRVQKCPLSLKNDKLFLMGTIRIRSESPMTLDEM